MLGTTVDYPLLVLPSITNSYPYSLGTAMENLYVTKFKEKQRVKGKISEDKTFASYRDFTTTLRESLEQLREIGCASKVFKQLKEKGVAIAMESMLPALLSFEIVKRMDWQEQKLIDYWTCSEIVDEERPSPAMIRSCMRHLHVRDPTEVVKVDDTDIGIEEGRNAGVTTIAVLTGTQIREQLEAEKPDAVLPSIRELPSWLTDKGYI